MTLTIHPETEAKLVEKARRDGTNVNDLADALLSAALDGEDEERADAISGIQRGLESAASGRVRSAEEVFADFLTLLNSQGR